MFVLGLVSARRYFALNPRRTWVKCTSWLLVSVAVLGALTDYAENFLLLEGTSAALPAAVHDPLPQKVALLSAFKFLLFLLNGVALLAMVGAFLVLRWRDRTSQLS